MASERFQRQIERLLDEAESAVFQFDWEKVRQCAQSVLAIDPDNSDGLTFLTNAERALGAAPPTASEPTSPAPAVSTSTTKPAHPTSFANGRYQVQQFLGEGGKKLVYLAQDTTLDREVAFALIKTDGLDATSRTRIQREAQAMGRLGSHPHIVTVFDLGEEAGQPYMVTELMRGGDVESMVETSFEKPRCGGSTDFGLERLLELPYVLRRSVYHRRPCRTCRRTPRCPRDLAPVGQRPADHQTAHEVPPTRHARQHSVCRRRPCRTVSAVELDSAVTQVGRVPDDYSSGRDACSG